MPEGGFDSHLTLRGGKLCDTCPDPVYATLLGASDTAGVGIWDASASQWRSANGDPSGASFLHQDVDIGAHDIAWVDDGSADGLLLVLTGVPAQDETDRGLRGQLLASSDGGDSWTPLANARSDAGGDPSLAASRRLGPWGNKDRPGGRLIQPTGSGQAFVGSQVGEQPSLALLDSTAALCTVGDTVLPKTTDYYDSSTGVYQKTPDNVISAIAWMPDEHNSGASSMVLAGYRQRDMSTTTGESALFRCTFGGDPSCGSTPSCVEIAGSEGIDVADIEVSQAADGSVSAFVADHGRRARNDGGVSPDTSNCLDLTETPVSGDSCGPRVWRWDIDLTDATGASDTLQDLVTPAGIQPDGLVFDTRTAQPVSGLTLSPDDVWLFAYTPTGAGSWYSAEAAVWRISVCEALAISDSGYDPTGCTHDKGWLSLTDDKFIVPGYGIGGQDMDGEYLRETELDPGSTWMADQAPQSFWSKIWDGVFYQADASVPRELVGNNLFGVWSWHEDSTGTYGPESDLLDGHNVSTVDEDTAIGVTFFDNAGDLGNTTWQGTVARDISIGTTGRLWIVDGDNGFVFEDEGSATRAERPGQLSTFGAGGMAVTSAPTNTGEDAVWIALHHKSPGDTPPYKQGILRSDDSGDSFCYQGAIEEDGAFRSFFGGQNWVGDKYDELFHQYLFSHSLMAFPSFDVGIDWLPCDDGSGGAADGSDEGVALLESVTIDGTLYRLSWGNPLDVVALDESVAVAAFQSYEATEDLTPESNFGPLSLPSNYEHPGRAAFTLDGGTTWSAIDFTDATANCATVPQLQEDLFRRNVHLALVPDGTAGGEGTYFTTSSFWRLDFFLLGVDSGELYESGAGACALWRVVVDTTPAGTTTTWTPLTIPFQTNGCMVEEPSGVAVAPWHDRIAIWGGYVKQKEAGGGPGHREEGGLCLMDRDGSNPQVVIDPADGFRFSIKDAVPHPVVQDQWIVSPFVDWQVQTQCARERSGGAWSENLDDAYDACDLALPFTVVRRPLGSPGPPWVTSDLSLVDGPHTLEGVALDERTKVSETLAGIESVTMELVYATAGAGGYRAEVSW